jgi:uncharacterized caspase-like protein
MSIAADATLFYFAGHAVQFQGHKYLLPIDAEVRDEISLPFETIAADNLRAVLDRSAGVKIMVLDAPDQSGLRPADEARERGRRGSGRAQSGRAHAGDRADR